MLEDNSNLPTLEEQQKYRQIIRQEKIDYVKRKQIEKGQERVQLEDNILISDKN